MKKIYLNSEFYISKLNYPLIMELLKSESLNIAFISKYFIRIRLDLFEYDEYTLYTNLQEQQWAYVMINSSKIRLLQRADIFNLFTKEELDSMRLIDLGSARM